MHLRSASGTFARSYEPSAGVGHGFHATAPVVGGRSVVLLMGSMTARRVVTAVAERGSQLVGLAKSEPSLEDVFVELVGRGFGEEDGTESPS